MNSYRFTKNRLLVTFLITSVLGVWSAPHAFAAVETPHLRVTSLTGQEVRLIGEGFQAGQIVQIEAQIDTCVASTTLTPTEGVFSVRVASTPECSGKTVITATSGTAQAFIVVQLGAPSGTGGPVDVPSTGTAPSTPTPTPTVPAQTLGVGGVATPPGAILATSDKAGQSMTISESGTPEQYRVYDGQGHTIGQIKIRANYVIVQNYRVRPRNNLGISIGYGDSKVHHVVVQNNDIKDVMGPGDINAMEMWGNDIVIAYNTAIDMVTGDAGGSHTDFIQTWNTHDGWNASDVIIVGNRATGEPDDANEHVDTHFNQAVIGEGATASSGGGGSGVSQNWFIADNYWTADCKFDDIENVVYTRNTFAGIDKRAVVVSKKSSNKYYYSDNRVADGGRTTVEIGAPVIPGPGPATPTWPGSGTSMTTTQAVPPREDAGSTAHSQPHQ